MNDTANASHLIDPIPIDSSSEILQDKRLRVDEKLTNSAGKSNNFTENKSENEKLSPHHG